MISKVLGMKYEWDLIGGNSVEGLSDNLKSLQMKAVIRKHLNGMKFESICCREKEHCLVTNGHSCRERETARESVSGWEPEGH